MTHIPRSAAGSAGFKKSKRSSQFATEKAIALAFKKARSVGMKALLLTTYYLLLTTYLLT